MNEVIEKHLAHRQALAEKFISAPEQYKVCDQCQSIWKITAGRCRVCGAYRWRLGDRDVIETAKLISQSPFPYTAGVAPRLG